MKVTIKDIAKACGVGVATVSRTVNNSGYVRQEIRENILRYIDNVGWKASNVATQLKTGKSRSVNILVNDILHYYNAIVVNGLCRDLRHLGYQVTLSVGQCGRALQESRAQRPGEAVIIVGFAHELRDEATQLRALGTRVVVVGEELGYDGPMVYPDHLACGYLLMERCIAAGHRKIAFFGACGSRPNMPSLAECHYLHIFRLLSGVCKAATDLGVEFDLPADTVGDFYGDLRHLQKKLQDGIHTVYICQTIELLISFYVTCRQLGLKIGRDVSVIGISGIDAFRAFEPEPELFTPNHEMVIKKTLDVFLTPEETEVENPVPYIHFPGGSLRSINNLNNQ